MSNDSIHVAYLDIINSLRNKIKEENNNWQQQILTLKDNIKQIKNANDRLLIDNQSLKQIITNLTNEVTSLQLLLREENEEKIERERVVEQVMVNLQTPITTLNRLRTIRESFLDSPPRRSVRESFLDSPPQRYTNVQFEEKLTKDSKCPICYEKMDLPMRIECGHHFCPNCLTKCRQHNERNCPVCRYPDALLSHTGPWN